MYYRCHSKECPTTGVREEAVDHEFAQVFEPLYFDDQERIMLSETLDEVKETFTGQREAETTATRLQLGHLRERMDRLTDAYIDRLIDRETFEQRKGTILMEEKTLQERMSHSEQTVMTRLSKFLGLAGDAYSLYQMTIPDERRCLLRIATSDRVVTQKTIGITLKSPFQDVANRYQNANGGPSRNRHRTLKALVHKLVDWFTKNPTEEFDVSSIRSDDYTSDTEDLKMHDTAA